MLKVQGTFIISQHMKYLALENQHNNDKILYAHTEHCIEKKVYFSAPVYTQESRDTNYNNERKGSVSEREIASLLYSAR